MAWSVARSMHGARTARATRTLRLALASCAVAACGGDGDGVNAPPAPEAVRTVRIALSRWRAAVGDSVRLAVTAIGADGRVVPGDATVRIGDSRVATLRDGWLVARDTGATIVEARRGSASVTTTFGAVPPSRFPVELRQGLGPDLPPAIAAMLPAVASRLREVIVGEEPEAVVDPASWGESARCGFRLAPAVTTRGVVVALVVDRLDGPGRGIAGARPCRSRVRPDRPGLATTTGIVTLDSADLRDFLAEGDSVRFEILVHEVMHVLGFGVFWDDALRVRFDPPLVRATPFPSYVGPRALAAWNRLLPVNRPLSMQAGFGHWDEATVGRELMSPLTDGEPEPFSTISVQALADLGYVVTSGGIDPYAPPRDGVVATSIGARVARGTGRVLHDIVLPPGWRTARVAVPDTT